MHYTIAPLFSKSLRARQLETRYMAALMASPWSLPVLTALLRCRYTWQNILG